MQSTRIVIDYLQNDEDYLRTRFGVQSLVLYGSYAKQKQSDTSDLDILFELESNLVMPIKRLANLENFIKDLCGVKTIDCVNKKFVKPIIYHEIEQYGIQIF